MHILYANCNYFDWNTHGLSQLQRFQVKCAKCELITMITSETQIVGANWNYFNWAMHSLSKLQRFKVKQAYLSREIRTVWANCNYFIWNKHSPRQLQQFQAKSCIVWSNGHYLSQLQLLQVKCAQSDPIVTISSKSGTVSVNDIYSNSNSGHPNGFPQDSTVQFGNFGDGNLKVQWKILYLVILDSHQFSQ